MIEDEAPGLAFRALGRLLIVGGFVVLVYAGATIFGLLGGGAVGELVPLGLGGVMVFAGIAVLAEQG